MSHDHPPAPCTGIGIPRSGQFDPQAFEAAITALLVRMGLLDAADSVVGKYLTDPLRNRRGIAVGEMRLAPGFAD